MALSTTKRKPNQTAARTPQEQAAQQAFNTGGFDAFFRAADQPASSAAAPAITPSPVVPAGGFDAFFRAADTGDAQQAMAAAFNPQQTALNTVLPVPDPAQSGAPQPPAGVSGTPPGPVNPNPAQQVPPPPPPPSAVPQVAVGTDLGAGGTYLGAAPAATNSPLAAGPSQPTSAAKPVETYNDQTHAAVTAAINNVTPLAQTAYASSLDPALSSLLGRQDETQRTQMELVAQLGRQAEQAGQQAAVNLALPKFVQPQINTALGTQALAGREKTAIQQALEARLLAALNGAGQEDPAVAALRAQNDLRAKATEAQTIEDLKRLGVLVGGGDTAGVLGNLRGQENANRLQLDAYAQQANQAALQQAMAYQQAQDALNLQEGQLVGNLRGTATLEAQRGQADLGLSLANLDQQNRQFEGNYNLQRLGMQQDVADRTLARLLTQTSPTQREIFGEGQRQALTGEQLSRQQLAQQGQQFTSDQQLQRELAAGQVSLGANRAPTETLAARQLALQQGEALGSINGQDTLAAQQLGLQRTQNNQANQLALAQLLGNYNGQQTLDARQLEQQNALATAGLTGRLNGQDTLAAQQLGLQRTAQSQANALATAELYGAGPNGQTTLGARQLAQQGSQFDRSLTAQQQADAQQAALQRELATGEISQGAGRAPAQSLALRQLLGDQSAQTRQLDLAAGELTGTYQGANTLGRDQLNQGERLALAELLGVTADGRNTLARDQLGQQDRQFGRQMSLAELQRFDQVNQEQLQRDQSERLALADLLGYYTTPGSGVRTETLGARQLSQQDRQFGAQQDLALAELLGITTSGQETLGARQLSQQDRQFGAQQDLATAELYGAGADGRQTLAGRAEGRQAQLDSIAQLIAAKNAGYDVGGLDISNLLLGALGFPANRSAGGPSTPPPAGQPAAPSGAFTPTAGLRDLSQGDVQARLASGEYYQYATGFNEAGDPVSFTVVDPKTGQKIGEIRR
jgi:hypothetical protein